MPESEKVLILQVGKPGAYNIHGGVQMIQKTNFETFSYIKRLKINKNKSRFTILKSKHSLLTKPNLTTSHLYLTQELYLTKLDGFKNILT